VQKQKKNTIFKSSKDGECLFLAKEYFLRMEFILKSTLQKKNRLILCTQ